MSGPLPIDVFVSAQEFRAQLEATEAQRDMALTYVRDLLAILRKHGGYTTTDQQQTMRGADALLVEVGAGNE
jgi:hypothetical protein